MFADSLILEAKALAYARQNSIRLNRKKLIGYGSDGTVWKSSRNTAVKALRHTEGYTKELECYKRLMAEGVTEIRGFSVPQLIGSDQELQVIEMKIVTPPYILDFAKVYFDTPPDFSAETWAYWNDERAEWFGAERWKKVELLLSALNWYGIYYVDPRPGNIMLGDEDSLED